MMTRELCSRCDLVFSLGSLKLWLTAPLLGLLISVSAIGADRSVPAGLEALKKLDGRLAKIASKNLAVLKLPTQDEEVEAGRQIAASLLAAVPLLEDPGLQHYVNQIGRWVASHGERPDLPWHFGVIDSPALNAFAIPGGYILITRGLYDSLSDPSELAGVLAHEIAHVVGRHHLKASLSTKLINEGANKMSELLAQGQEDITRLLLGTGASLISRKLDQSVEFEADQMGVVLATRAGFDPFGLPSVLTKLEALPNTDNRVSLLFRTHPLPATRLQQLDAVMGDKLANYMQSGSPEPLYRQ
jgi:predicted Zn-dependent protease